MALNPAYTAQSTRVLPFCLGIVKASGDLVNQIVGYDNSTNQQYLLGDGSWHDCPMFSLGPSQAFVAPAGLLNVPTSNIATKFNIVTVRADYFRFHRGDYTPKGLPLNLMSVGPDQGSENWLQYYPSITPALCYSGTAYYCTRAILQSTGLLSNISVDTMQPVGIFRTTHVRTFDASGDVTAYGFSVNPAWQMVETLLRFRYKPQQPGLAGLTAAEAANFDWPSIVALAERCGAIQSNGLPLYMGNWAFAADTALDAMMEAQLRNCRAFKRERNGVIGFVPDDARTAVFIASMKAVVPGSIKLDNKDVTNAGNIIVAQYRDLQLPAVAEVSIITTDGAASTTFTTIGNQPFFSSDYFTYAGGDNDALFAGDYRVALYVEDEGTSTGALMAPPIPDQFNAEGGPISSSEAHGGYVSTQAARFKPRSCDVVQHRAHQKAFSQFAPGITALAQKQRAVYDFGNNTFDQATRLAQFMMIRDLGPDVTPYIPPIAGTISLFAEAVDVNGACVGELEPGDVLEIDPTADPVFAGLYVIGDNDTYTPASAKSPATRSLPLQQYQPTAYTQAPIAADSSYQTLGLDPALSFADDMLSNPFFIMSCTPTGGVAGDGTITMQLADLSIWWMGDSAPTAYSGVQLTEIPANHLVIIYLTVTTKTATPTMSMDTTDEYPPVPLPAGVTLIYYGSIQASTLTPPSGGGTTARPAVLPASGGLGAAILTPAVGYLAGTSQTLQTLGQQASDAVTAGTATSSTPGDDPGSPTIATV